MKTNRKDKTIHVVKENATGEEYQNYRGNGKKVFLQSLLTGNKIEVRFADYKKNFEDVDRYRLIK